MSTKKKLTFYPENYKRFFDAAIANGTHICVCQTPSKARKLRQNLYQFRYSARNLAEIGKLSTAYCKQLFAVQLTLTQQNLVLSYHETRVPTSLLSVATGDSK